MDRLWSGIGAVSRAAAWGGAIMIFAAALIVTAEILTRKVSGVVLGNAYTFTGSDEIAGYLFAAGTSWALAHVLVTRGHVRIDVLYGYFSPGVRAACDLLALLVLAFFAIVLLERAGALFLVSLDDNVRSNTTLRVPLKYPQGAWVFGLALFVLALLVALLRSVVALVGGDMRRLQETAGASTQDEEIRSELDSHGITTAPTVPRS